MADMARRRSAGVHMAMTPDGIARKRKYDEMLQDSASNNNGPTSDFPCHYCSAIFVTEISLSRHVLTFHDAEVDVDNGDVEEEAYPQDNEQYLEENEEEEGSPQVNEEYLDENEDEEGSPQDNENYSVENEDDVEVSQDNDQYSEEHEEEADVEENMNVSVKYEAQQNGYFQEEEDYYYGDDGTQETGDISEYLDNSGQVEQYESTTDADEFIQMGNLSSNFTPTKSNNGGGAVKAKLSAEDLASVLKEVEEITSNTTSEFVTCPLCRKTFGRKELPIHVSCEHGGTKFTCPYCNRAISRRDHLKRHIKNVHPEMCTETEIGPFPRNLNLSRAVISSSQQKKPPPPIISINDESMAKLPISIVAPLSQMMEDECNENDEFEGEEENQSMRKRVKSEEDSENDSMQITVEPDLPFQDFNDYGDDSYNASSFMLDSFDPMSSKSNLSLGLEGPALTIDNMAYQCSLCNAVFTSKVLLDRHEATHSELRPHKCSICSKGFLRKEHLSKHLSSVHSGMKFTCEFCGKDISRKDHLIRHIRNVHPNQFYSLPPEASQEMAAQHLHTVQLKTAQSLQPKPKKPFFNCDMCEATFINVDDLHAHQATVHSDVRKYKCNYCCKAFKRKEHLTKHEVLHTGERNHCCRICGSEFQRKDALQDHIRRTHGIDNRSMVVSPKAVPTHPCNLCDQLFQDRGMLLSHMTTVHGLIVNSPPGLPRNIQQIRVPPPAPTSQPKPLQRNSGSKPNVAINGSNLGSLMDLINKGSITLSFHPVKTE